MTHLEETEEEESQGMGVGGGMGDVVVGGRVALGLRPDPWPG